MTLIELVLTLAVVGVVLTVGVPSLRAVARSIDLSSATNAFVSGLHLARSESIKRKGRVVLCKSSDGRHCSFGGGWEQGWIVFDDGNGNGVRDDGELILRQGAALPRGMRLVGNLPVARYVSFAPGGGTLTVSGAFQAGTLVLCHLSSAPTQARRIVLSAAGRPRVQRAEVPACS